MDACELFLDILRVLARLPRFMPITADTTGSGIDDFKHVFGRIFLVVTLAGTIAFKVIEKGPGVLANGAEVDSLSTFGKEKQPVEFLEQNGTRLMDGAKNCLTSICEFAKEGADGPR